MTHETCVSCGTSTAECVSMIDRHKDYDIYLPVCYTHQWRGAQSKTWNESAAELQHHLDQVSV